MSSERGPSRKELIARIDSLTEKLRETEEALAAIREGEVDAIVVSGSRGEQIFSLAASDVVYRLIVQAMNEAALTTTLDGTILFCNAQFGRLIEASLDELVGRKLAELVLMEDGEGIASLVHDAASRPVKSRIVFNGKSGPVPALVSATPLEQPDGPALCIVAADLTELETSAATIQELHRQQDLLVKSTERFAVLSETAGQLLGSKDPRGIVNALCRRVMEITHCQIHLNYLLTDDGSALRLNAHGGIAPKIAADLGTLALGQAVCGAVAKNGQPIVVESVQASKDPRTRLIRSMGIDSYACHPLTSQGKVIGTLSFGSRDRPAFSADDLALIRTVTDQVAIAMERARAEESLTRMNEELEARVASRTEELTATIAQLRREAESRARAERELREEAETLAAARESLRQANAALEQKTRQLRNLAGELAVTEQRERRRLAGMLHDHLQQLLVAARYQVELLGRRSAADLHEAVSRTDELLGQAITLSRTLTAELSPPVLHTSGLGPSLQWLVQWIGERQDLTVSLDLPPALPPMSEDITIQLFQSVRELLFNVAKHAHVRTADLQLKERGDALRFTVSDSGVGFDPSLLGEKAGTESFGIFSIRERLELIGGELEIESEPGKGSRFTIVVPISELGNPPRSDESPTPIDRGRPSDRPTFEGASRTRVLLVEDHEITRKGLVELLAKEPDLEVVGDAADGKTALKLIGSLTPDVVLMDVSMPGMNGIEATRLILGLYPQVKIVGLSMYEDERVGSAMREAGAVMYLSKADAPRLLVAAVRSCARGKIS